MQPPQNIIVDRSAIARDPLGTAVAYQSYLAALPTFWRQQDHADALESLAHEIYRLWAEFDGLYWGGDMADHLTDLYHVFAEDNAP